MSEACWNCGREAKYALSSWESAEIAWFCSMECQDEYRLKKRTSPPEAKLPEEKESPYD